MGHDIQGISCINQMIVQYMQNLPELTLEELLESITEPPEPEVDWGNPMGDEVW